MRDILENKARQTRSIYGSYGCPASRDASRHAGHNKYGPDEYNRPSSSELRRDIAQYRGAAHPLCFTDEVMDHQIPEGFKPVNIKSYDGTTDPAVWIEDFLLHIHMARGDNLQSIKSNTSHSSLKDQLGIGLTACQRNQLDVGRTWKPHSLITSRARTCDHKTPMT